MEGMVIDPVQGGALLAFVTFVGYQVAQQTKILRGIRDALVLLEERTRGMGRKRRRGDTPVDEDADTLVGGPRGRRRHREQAWTPLQGVPILGRVDDDEPG